MASDKTSKTFSFNKQMNFEKEFFPFSKTKKSSNKGKSILSTFGAILNIIWFLSILPKPPISPQQFILIGGISLVLTFIIKVYSRLTTQPELLELQGGGSVLGYVVTWVLVQIYSKIGENVTLFNNVVTVRDVLSYYLILIFLIWFFIPSKSSASQELLFNLPPIISYFLFNMWKLIIILLFLGKEWNLTLLNSFIEIIFVVVCIIELVGMYQRIFKLDITDFILDLYQIVIEIIKGPVVSLKWSILILVLILLNLLPSNYIILALLGFSILMSIISITTFVSRLTIDSGLIERKSNQAKIAVPQIFSEIKELRADDFQENYYQVVKSFEIKRNAKVTRYFKGDVLFKIPLKKTLQSMAGIYVARLAFSDKAEKNKYKKKYKNGKSIDLNIKTIGKFNQKEWDDLVHNESILIIESDTVLNQIGIPDKEAFDATLEQRLKDFAKIQDNVRDRIRGVPSAWHIDKGEVYELENLNQGIPIPEDVLEELKNSGISKIEVIPGKDEYLYYIRKKT